MAKFSNTMDVFKLLPKTNCRKCHKPTCLAFAHTHLRPSSRRWAGIAVGLDRNNDTREATRFIEKMMLGNKMAVIASFTDPGNYQCHDCGYGHDCAAGSVYQHLGLCTAEYAEKNRPVEYGDAARKQAKAIGKILGSILNSRQ